MKFDILAILDLVKLGVIAGKEIVNAVRAGKAEVQKDGRAMSAEELEADIDATIAAALAAGDAAADRIERRSQADGDDGA